MVSVLRACLVLLAGVNLSPLGIKSARTELHTDIPAGKVQDATSKICRITHLRTGSTVYPNGTVSNRGPRVVAYDNLSNPGGDPNGLLNFAYSRQTGELLCVYPIDPNDVFFTTFLAQGDGACDDPNTAGFTAPSFPSVGITDPLDILWDDYRMDLSIAEPNEIAAVEVIDFTFLNMQGAFGTPANSNYVLEYNLVFFERTDFDADGLFEATDGVIVQFLFDGNDSGGLYTASVDIDQIDPNGSFAAYGDGLLLNDFTNVFFDEATGTIPIEFACGVGDALAGGGLPSSDPLCTAPEDLITAGFNDSAFWVFANDTQGDPNFPPPDHNYPIDPGTDGDPNSLSYTDILNDARLINIGYWDIDTGRFINSAVARRLHVPGGPLCNCGPGCETPGGCSDVNLDGAVDLSDLAIVLRDFGLTHAVGDANNDNVVDLTDLALVLAAFGTACPC